MFFSRSGAIFACWHAGKGEVLLRRQGETLLARSRSPHAGPPTEACFSGATGEWNDVDAAANLCAVARRRASVTLDLRHAALSVEVRVPRAVLRDLPGALRHGLPVWTPFRAEEVIVSAKAKVLSRTQASLTLVYVPRASMQVDCALARQAGFEPQRAWVGEARHVWLSPQARRASRVLLGAEWGLIALAAWLALSIPARLLDNVRREEARLDEHIQAERMVVRRQTELLSRIRAFEAVTRQAIEYRNRVPSLTALLAELLPLMGSEARLLAFERVPGQVRLLVQGMEGSGSFGTRLASSTSLAPIRLRSLRPFGGSAALAAPITEIVIDMPEQKP